MSQPSAHGVHLQPDTKEKSGSSTQETPHVLEEVPKKPTAHMLQCSQFAHPCFLHDLITFNDVGKQWVEPWKQ